MLSISYQLCFHFTQAAFPVERDVAELAGVSTLKRWIVFMEKITQVCLHDIKTKDFSSLTDSLRCMTKKNSLRLLRYDTKWIHRYPNILQAEGSLHLKIIVHRQFNLNVTVMHYFEDEDTTYGGGGPYLTISGKRYSRLLYPFTFMSSGNSIEIAFPVYTDICIGIEYSISQRFNLTNYRQIEANGMYFLWSSFLVSCFRVHVDMRARLALNTTSCCKLLVYDGPTGKLPIIMKSNGTCRSQRVIASTFQVFVVLIEDIHLQETVMSYAPIYINTAVYNLTMKNNVEIKFDNRTYCHGYSLYARLCEFTFYTSGRKIRFYLKDLHFTGKYSGSHSEAGIVFFNYFNGTTEKLAELNNEFWYKITDFEIISTGSEMHISVFGYFLYASIALRFWMSTTNCNTFLVGNNHISYSGHIIPVPGKWNVFQINQSSKALLEYNLCYRFQFIHIENLEFRIKFIFPEDVNPMQVTMHHIPLHPYAFHSGCSFYEEGQQHRTYLLENTDTLYSNIFEKKRIFSLNSFEIEYCNPSMYSHFQIIVLPCKIPCPYFIREKYCISRYLGPSNVVWEDSVNITCDICENVYIFCNEVRLESNIIPMIKIKSKVCEYATLELRISQPNVLLMFIALNGSDIVSVEPTFKVNEDLLLQLHVTSCVVEIPVSAMKWVRNSFPKKTVATAFHWGGALYHTVHQHLEVSWEEAASYCQESGASLLTIHSQTEFQFIKEKLLKTYSVLVLYIGVKKKVIYLWNLRPCYVVI